MNKTLATWLHELEHRHLHEIQLGLERIHEVATRLDLLKTEAKIISVAGTNGKGSTVATLSAIYQRAGYQVGSYTSPHLISYNERIKVNGVSIRDEELVRTFHQIEMARGSICLTYFETSTLAALLFFQQHKLDIILLEVGLGGRLDATNIMDNDVAIITTIGLDHEAYLGDNLEAIGYEKAGIIRPQKTVIYADYHPPASVLAQVKSCQATFYCLGYDFNGKEHQHQFYFSHHEMSAVYPAVKLHPHSVAAALMAVHTLQNQLPVQSEAIQRALSKLSLPGRFHYLDHPKPTLLDVTHNPQAALNFYHYVREQFPGKRLFAVFSTLADKDSAAMIKAFSGSIERWYPCTLSSKRALDAQQLIDILQ